MAEKHSGEPVASIELLGSKVTVSRLSEPGTVEISRYDTTKRDTAAAALPAAAAELLARILYDVDDWKEIAALAKHLHAAAQEE